MKYIEFKRDGRQYRIFGQRRPVHARGYEPTTELFNVVEVRRGLGPIGWWQELESEQVPVFAWVSSACLGTCDWKSELITKWRGK